MDPKIVKLWGSIDKEFLEKIDNLTVEHYWDPLIEQYYEEVSVSDKVGIQSSYRSIIIFMRSLMISPDILQPKFKKDSLFTDSVNDFLTSYFKHYIDRKLSRRLLKDILLNAPFIIGDCPDIYRKEPVQFINALASILISEELVIDDFYALKPSDFNIICVKHELYADICMVSPRTAFMMAEQRSLWPAQSQFDGITMEHTLYVLQFFRLQTSISPFVLDGQVMYNPVDLPDTEVAAQIELMRPLLERTHAAQADILYSFVMASYISRDYIFNVIAALCEANLSRRANPSATGLSSDGLMINLTQALLDMLPFSCNNRPTAGDAKRFFLYIFSDITRIDFLKGNMPADGWERTHVVNTINALRPPNFLSHRLSDTDWLRVLQASPETLLQMIDDGLECKPRAMMSDFVKALCAPTDGITFSPTVVSLKTFYDYSYNYYVTGKRTSPVAPTVFGTLQCSTCKQTIMALPYYRCICCNEFFLCKECYKQETHRVVSSFCPPFNEEVRNLFYNIDNLGCVDDEHHPLTHFFTELRKVAIIISNRPVFRITPAFPPLMPQSYQKVYTDLHETKKVISADMLKEKLQPLDPVMQDDNYESWDGVDEMSIRRYDDTICYCLTNRQCKCHGPATQTVRRAGSNLFHSKPENIEAGFVHNRQCFQCKTRPLIGVVYRCLQCSLELCKSCYERDMEIGGGVPSHQMNHIFILMTHPISDMFFLVHHRNDMRTVDNAAVIYPNELTATGVSLDQFEMTTTDHLQNMGNLRTEVFMLVVKLMTTSLVALFQDFHIMAMLSKASGLRKARNLQLCVDDMMDKYVCVSQHISYYLLTLLTFETPCGFPIPDGVWLHSVIKDSSFTDSFKLKWPSPNVQTMFRDLRLLGVTASPLFGIMSTALLDVVIFSMGYYMRTVSVETLRTDMEAGRLDFSLILLLVSLDATVVSNVTTRFNVMETLHQMMTISKKKDDILFLLEYPTLRQMLFMFSMQLFIDSVAFKDQTVGRPVQVQINKVIILLLRSNTCGENGLREVERLLPEFGLESDLFMRYVQDVIRQASAVQDILDDVLTKIVDLSTAEAHVPQGLRALGQNLMEYVKTSINLFVRLITCPYSRSLVISGYLLKRTTRFMLMVLASICKPLYRDNIPLLSRHLLMHFDKWMNVIVEEILQLVRYAYPISQISQEMQPSVAVAIDPDPAFKNSVLIAFVEDDGLFSLDVMRWVVKYCSTHDVVVDQRQHDFEAVVQLMERYQNHFTEVNIALEDCPDEFLDSLMDTVMLDPVVLPSGNRCDRSTIVRMMINNPIDPFTRSPLTEDMIQPDEDLRMRIKQYLKGRLNALQEHDEY